MSDPSWKTVRIPADWESRGDRGSSDCPSMVIVPASRGTVPETTPTNVDLP